MIFKESLFKKPALFCFALLVASGLVLSGCMRIAQDRIEVVNISQTGELTYESYQLERVQPGGSSAFDPFTFGRTGSPFGKDGLFPPGGSYGGGCGPMTVPFDPEFADPGDEHGSIIIIGNGNICQPTINTFAANVAVVFSTNFPDEVRGPWSIVATSKPTFITVTNGAVTIRFTYTRDSDSVVISKVEFL